MANDKWEGTVKGSIVDGVVRGVIEGVVLPPTGGGGGGGNSALLTDLVAWWPMDDETDAHGSYTLTNNNSVTFIAGKVGNCAHFVKTSSQSLTSAASFNMTGDATFAMWVRPHLGTGGVNGYFGHAAGTQTLADRSPNTIWAEISDIQKDTAITPLVDTWFCVVFGREGTDGFWSIDGSAKSTFASNATARDGTFIFGSDGGTFGYIDIDEACVASRAWSDDDIALYYNSGSGIAYPG